VGVPLGAALIQRIRPDTFRRVCMSFDAWIVAFGLSTLLKDLGLVASNWAYLVLIAVAILDSVLLYRFFAVQLPMARRAEARDTGRPPAHVASAPSASASARDRSPGDISVAAAK